MTAPAPAPAGAPPIPVRAANTAGTVGLVLAIVLAVLAALSGTLSTLLPWIVSSAHLPLAAFGVILAIPSYGSLLLGIAALVLGIVGVTRRGLPHARAGAAVAVGAFVVVSFAVGQASVAIVPAVVAR
jgi:hypothetical protein